MADRHQLDRHQLYRHQLDRHHFYRNSIRLLSQCVREFLRPQLFPSPTRHLARLVRISLCRDVFHYPVAHHPMKGLWTIQTPRVTILSTQNIINMQTKNEFAASSLNFVIQNSCKICICNFDRIEINPPEM